MVVFRQACPTLLDGGRRRLLDFCSASRWAPHAARQKPSITALAESCEQELHGVAVLIMTQAGLLIAHRANLLPAALEEAPVICGILDT